MSQLSASAVFRQASTAARFGTGRTPGRPRQTSHTYVFGAAFSGATAQPQNIFVFVFGWTWTSMPITTSQLSIPLTPTLSPEGERGRPPRCESRLLLRRRAPLAGPRSRPTADPAPASPPEARPTRLEVFVCDVRCVDRGQPVPDTVEPGKVRRALGRGDDVVRGEAVVGMRQRDVDDLRAGVAQDEQGGVDRGLDTWLDPLDLVVLARDAQAHSLDATAGVVQHLEAGTIGRCRIQRVEPRHQRERDRSVVDRPRERTDLVGARREGDQPIAADPAIRRLHADHAA